MAHIANLIAVLDDDAFEVVRVLASIGQSCDVLTPEAFHDILNWGSVRDAAKALTPMAEQNVGYRKVPVPPHFAPRAERLLKVLKDCGELHYPVAPLAGGTLIFISVVDFETLITLARGIETQSLKRPGRIARLAETLRPIP